ncbi:proteasome lid subunit RPN8/RPN11 [Pelomonas saccharophila]|uniref:Proteasome lid subunit RPN8/RPN11 n=1 Tax=Roseateles saccharophilus TaxID=304 RepID=A0ABU1YY14_ROSSA|nr:hypothetical protein [Roseateles saccharophilus]MDR7273126.1 proteasome lid subunit RPN8/RPN11 [Roseateles saccharophilus]
MASKQIQIPLLTWRRLVGDLMARGSGTRETGAFLMGKKGDEGRAVVDYLCYDDLDRRALAHGIVEFHRGGFSKLWDVCKDRSLKVLADVHTHPTRDVRQSFTDKANPMLPVRGHVALILPKYGATSRWSLAPAGIYRFAGAGQWDTFHADAADCPVKLSLW